MAAQAPAVQSGNDPDRAVGLVAVDEGNPGGDDESIVGFRQQDRRILVQRRQLDPVVVLGLEVRLRKLGPYVVGGVAEDLLADEALDRIEQPAVVQEIEDRPPQVQGEGDLALDRLAGIPGQQGDAPVERGTGMGVVDLSLIAQLAGGIFDDFLHVLDQWLENRCGQQAANNEESPGVKLFYLTWAQGHGTHLSFRDRI